MLFILSSATPTMNTRRHSMALAFYEMEFQPPGPGTQTTPTPHLDTLMVVFSGLSSHGLMNHHFSLSWLELMDLPKKSKILIRLTSIFIVTPWFTSMLSIFFCSSFLSISSLVFGRLLPLDLFMPPSQPWSFQADSLSPITWWPPSPSSRSCLQCFI